MAVLPSLLRVDPKRRVRYTHANSSTEVFCVENVILVKGASLVTFSISDSVERAVKVVLSLYVPTLARHELFAKTSAQISRTFGTNVHLPW